MNSKRMWLAWLTASLMTAGTFAVMAEDAAPAANDQQNPPRRMRERGDAMQRLQDSPEFKAAMARRQEIRQAMQEYRKLDDAKKPEAEAKIKALLKTDLEATLKAAQDRLTQARERLDKMEAELKKRSADIDTAVNEQFQRMKEGKRPGMGGMFGPEGQGGGMFGPEGQGNRPPKNRGPKPADEETPPPPPADGEVPPAEPAE